MVINNLLEQLSEVLSPELYDLLTPQELENTNMLDREVGIVFKPKTKLQLGAILTFCSKNKLAIHPISTGKNWGLGSFMPAQDHTALLDLSHMNKIIGFDAQLGTVRIEPGVTQAQLADFLEAQNSAYFLDVTGSGKDTSIVGNALERGISYYGQRHKQVLQFEALLPNGEVYRSGFGESSAEVSALYPAGLGPDAAGMFFQSNLGIVTEMTIALRKRQEVQWSIAIGFDSLNFDQAYKDLNTLLQASCIDFTPHIASRQRLFEIAENLFKAKAPAEMSSEQLIKTMAKLLPNEWIISASVSGPKSLAKQKLKEIKKHFGPYARVRATRKTEDLLVKIAGFLGFKKTQFIFETLASLRNLNTGKPTNDALYAFDPKGQNPDRSATGFMYNLPIGANRFEVAESFIKIQREVEERTGLDSAITLNVIDPYILECVWSVRFDKTNDDQRIRAAQASLFFREACRGEGLLPYRVSPSVSEDLSLSSQAGIEMYKILKKRFDPSNILSPGRWKI